LRKELATGSTLVSISTLIFSSFAGSSSEIAPALKIGRLLSSGTFGFSVFSGTDCMVSRGGWDDREAACAAANAGREDMPKEFLRDKLLRRPLSAVAKPIGGSNDDAVG
jgi:hypothetical protein